MNTHRRRFSRRVLGAVAGLRVLAAACGSDDASTSDTSNVSTPPSVDGTTAPDPTTGDTLDDVAAERPESCR